jgi:hypothetical protein
MPSEASLKQYARVIANLEGRGIDFTDHKTAIGIIQTKMNGETSSLATQASVLSAVKHHLADKPSDLAFYTAEHDKVKKELIRTTSYKKTEKFVEWDEVMASYEKNKSLTMAVYTLFPPRRLEWRLVKVVGDMSEAKEGTGLNYYAKKDMMLVFQEYKTKGKYGFQCFILRKGSPLERILYEQPEGLLFHDSMGDAYDAKAFSKKVKRDTKMSVNDFRHSYITHFLKSAPSVASKLETAEMMAHTIGTQAKYQKDDESSSSDSE